MPRAQTTDELARTIHRVLIERGLSCPGRHAVGTAACQGVAAAVRELGATTPTWPAHRLAAAINAFVVELQGDDRDHFHTDAAEVQRWLLPLLEERVHDAVR